MKSRYEGQSVFDRQFDANGLLTDMVVVGSVNLLSSLLWAMVWMGLPSSTFLAVLLFWGGWNLGPVVVFETVVVLWSVKIFARPPIRGGARGSSAFKPESTRGDWQKRLCRQN